MILKLAIQKTGRLAEDSLKLLNNCGITIRNGGNGLKAMSENFPVEAYFLSDEDIPQYVQDGVADIGIVGENVLYEKCKDVEILRPLGFGKCRLSIAILKHVPYENLKDLEKKKIATRYPFLVEQFLRKHRIEAEIQEVTDTVEITPGIGLADAACDLVSTGSTLFMNGLKEVEIIMESQAVLIRNVHLKADKLSVVEKILFRIAAVNEAEKNKYILLNAPNEALPEIISLLPGLKSPTVLPLAKNGWSSVHSVLNEDEFWEKIEALKQAGAEGILLIPVEKMIT